jgi:hypothetical protein
MKSTKAISPAFPANQASDRAVANWNKGWN